MSDAYRAVTRRVRITQSHGPLSWYADHVGYEFDVRDWSADRYEVVGSEIREDGKARLYRMIRKGDATTVY